MMVCPWLSRRARARCESGHLAVAVDVEARCSVTVAPQNTLGHEVGKQTVGSH